MKSEKRRLFAVIVFCFGLIVFGATNVNASSRKRLYEHVTENAVLDSTKEFNFWAGADENEAGVYIESRTSEDEYPVYYYRGLPEDNNVIFGGFCWQILRTTDLGNIKLIYNGASSDGECTATGGDTNTIASVAYASSNDSRIYGGYVYELDGESHDSVIKAALDEWYENNLIDYEDDLADDIWCNSVDWEANRDRIINLGAPSNECSNESAQMSVSSEIGNGKLQYPIATITVDELMFGGAGYGTDENHNYYLTTGNKFHTITQQSEKKMFYQNSKYTINRTGSLTYETGARAVIALPNSTIILSGNGSKNSPWMVAVPKFTADSVEDTATVEGADDDTLFAEGETIRIVPKEGRIGEVVFYDDDDEEVNVDYRIENDGSCSFVMPAYNVKFKIILAQNNPATGDSIQEIIAGAAIGLSTLVAICYVKMRR
jgi:hypothetical protein